jgi:hypothetical protein
LADNTSSFNLNGFLFVEPPLNSLTGNLARQNSLSGFFLDDNSSHNKLNSNTTSANDGNGFSAAFATLDQAIGLSLQLVSSMPTPFAMGFSLAFAVNDFAETGDATGLILGAAGIVTMFNPCGVIAKAFFAYGAVTSAAALIGNPGDAMAGFHAMGLVGSVAGFLGGCFTGDMLIDVEGGKKRADEIKVGEMLWSRDEYDSDGPLVLRAVEERFAFTAEVWNLRVGGQLLRTTGGHPFWVENRSRWLGASELRVGDWLRTRDGSLVSVEGVEETGDVESVYNWRVADYHTYFVSATEEGESVWAHNAGGCGDGEDTYSRPSGFREGVRDEVWNSAIEESTGRVRDPLTGRFIGKDQAWDMGHKPGFEFRNHAKSAQERGISRGEFLDEHNNPSHYRPELPSSNRSHAGEDMTGNYFGP